MDPDAIADVLADIFEFLLSDADDLGDYKPHQMANVALPGAQVTAVTERSDGLATVDADAVR